jgi:hypothetical protein
VSKRRSLDDALTPDEEEFLKRGTASKSKPKKEMEDTPMSRPALKEQFVPDKQLETPPPKASQSGVSSPGSINARIDPRITTALLRGSVERRIQGLTPHTQRDIIAEALTNWLTKHGFLE